MLFRANRKTLYVGVDTLTTVPPSCINRDDTGSPKTCEYGLVNRAFVSSQCKKRAILDNFAMMGSLGSPSIRTKQMVLVIAKQIQQINPGIPDEVAEDMADIALRFCGLNKGKSKSILYNFSEKQIELTADLICKELNPEKLPKPSSIKTDPRFVKILQDNLAVDTAFQGNFFAENKLLSHDSHVQFSPLVSTHVIHNNYDHFTAVDDYNNGTGGAAHMDVTEFNSATYYHYMNCEAVAINKEIVYNVPRILRDYLELVITAFPSGKMSSFGNFVRPDLVYITIDPRLPTNNANAFLQPIKAPFGKEDEFNVAEASEIQFVNYVKKSRSMYDDTPAFSVGISRFGELSELTNICNLKNALDQVEDYLSSYLKDSGVA